MKKYLKSTQIHQLHNQQQLHSNKAKHLIKFNSHQIPTKKCQPLIVLNKFNIYLNNHGMVFNLNLQVDLVHAIFVIKNACF